MTSALIDGDRLVADDGTVLYMKSWPETGGLRAVLFFVHGLGEHINRYERLFAAFTGHGIRVHGFDHRGHGRTYALNSKSMKLGHLGDLWTAVRDVEVLLRTDRNAGVPRFLMGHSMGGLIALAFALDAERTAGLHGIISSAPALQPGSPIPRVKLTLGRLFARITPRLTISAGLDVNNISRLKQEVDDFLADPLCTTKISLQTANSILNTGESIMSSDASSMAVPLILTHGSADVITCPKASARFVEKLACDDKSFVDYPDAYHNLHLDLIRDTVVQDYIQWILERSPQS